MPSSLARSLSVGKPASAARGGLTTFERIVLAAATLAVFATLAAVVRVNDHRLVGRFRNRRIVPFTAALGDLRPVEGARWPAMRLASRQDYAGGGTLSQMTQFNS
jgi:hypothetical protein